MHAWQLTLRFVLPPCRACSVALKHVWLLVDATYSNAARVPLGGDSVPLDTLTMADPMCFQPPKLTPHSMYDTLTLHTDLASPELPTATDTLHTCPTVHG